VWSLNRGVGKFRSVWRKIGFEERGRVTQFDEELSRRAEELRRVAADVSKDFRKLASDVRDQMEVFAEDVRKRARGSSPFEQSAIERIRAWAELRDEGIITEEEFQEQKRRLLDQV
jgi:hypothetical protein